MKRVLTNDELRTFEKMFSLTQDGLLKLCKAVLKKKYKTVFATKDYILAIGSDPVALVAHLDTVFSHPPTEIFYDRVKNVMWSPDGLGADDRAGVYSILQILKTDLRPTVIFTTDEEYGGIGADVLSQTFPECPIPDLKYIIELDRRGGNDCVFYDCDSPQFEEYVENYGFTYAYGSFSDISIICPDWGVAGVNLSIGYQNEHSVSETLNLTHMFNTIKRVKQMIRDSHQAPYFKYIPSPWRNRFWGPQTFTYNTDNLSASDRAFLEETGYDPAYNISPQQWIDWMRGTPVSQQTQYICKNCGKECSEHEVLPVKHNDGGHYYLCHSCLVQPNAVHWCEHCSEAFEPENENDTTSKYCKDCKENLA